MCINPDFPMINSSIYALYLLGISLEIFPFAIRLTHQNMMSMYLV